MLKFYVLCTLFCLSIIMKKNYDHVFQTTHYGSLSSWDFFNNSTRYSAHLHPYVPFYYSKDFHWTKKAFACNFTAVDAFIYIYIFTRLSRKYKCKELTQFYGNCVYIDISFYAVVIDKDVCVQFTTGTALLKFFTTLNLAVATVG